MKNVKFEISIPSGTLITEIDNESRSVTKSVNGIVVEVITARTDEEWKTFQSMVERLISGVTLE